MWYLTSENDPRVIYVTSNKEITIGRSIDSQVCNFALHDDASVSRRHAILSVSDNKLFLQDLGSRYGTFANSEEKIDSNIKVPLNCNDVVKFGKLNNLWKVNTIAFVTCTSTLKGENLQKLKLSLSKLGGILKNEWDDTCVYLTMPAITLTIKVVLALAQGSFIVTTEYWEKCVEAVNNNLALPEPSQFTPQVIESTLNKHIVSFKPNDKRKTIFEGKKFVFFSKRQLEMYKAVLLKSSANPFLLSDSSMTKAMLCEEDVIVIQFNVTSNSQEAQSQRENILEIVNYLKSKNKRVVADAEIGLAILYCSVDKYCNPAFNFSAEVIKQSSTGVEKIANVLAKETQESSELQNVKEDVVIDESLNPPDKTVSNKRKLSDDNDDACISFNKKLATENIPVKTESAKRKNCEEHEEQLNPTKKLAVGNDEDSQELFNFTSNTAAKENSSDMKLNFSKPLKRNEPVSQDDDEELFNFIPSKKNKQNIEAVIPVKIINPQKIDKVNETKTTVDISAMRGVKLKELMQSTLNYNDTNILKLVKKEKIDDLDSKMSELDLGSTIIKLRTDLIIKKEPQPIETSINSPLKNFKKFKKVWPVKMQVTVIPSSINIVTADLSENQLHSMAGIASGQVQ